MTRFVLELANRLDRLADWLERQVDRFEVAAEIARIRRQERGRNAGG